jgi:putative ABC transport system permease protein
MSQVKRGKLQGLRTIFRLSLRDYSYERLLTACAVMGLAAILAPLLVLFGVKSGIINTMVDRLVKDPRNLELSPVGSGRYSDDWFTNKGALPEVAFIIPQTRSIAANMILYNKKGPRSHTLAVDLIPTDKGDPLLQKWGKIPTHNSAIVLSASAARKLRVSAGQTIIGRVGRSVHGKKEQVKIKLTVTAVLPIEAFMTDAAFVRLDLLEATEDYRDGYSAGEFGWPGKERQERPREYSSFRLYARSIYDVAALRDRMTSQGLEIYTRAEEIELVRSLDRSFNLIFRLIAVVAVCGYFASMASNILANVNRKSRHLGITRLLGFSTKNIVWFPIVQAIATSVLGTGLAACLYLISELIINRLFAQYLSKGEYVCRLSVNHLAMAFMLTVFLSILASGYAAFRVAKIEPSKVVRDV